MIWIRALMKLVEYYQVRETTELELTVLKEADRKRNLDAIILPQL